MGVYFCVHALEYFAILVLPNEIYNMATDFLFLVPFSVKMIKTYFTNSYSKLLTSILCAKHYLFKVKRGLLACGGNSYSDSVGQS